MTRLDRLTRRQLVALYGTTVALWAVLSVAGSVIAGSRLMVVRRELVRQLDRLYAERDLAQRIEPLREQHTTVTGDVASLAPTEAPEAFGPKLLADLAGLAEAHELAMVGANPAPPGAEVGPVVRRELTALFRGRYAGVLSFVEALQQAPRVVSVLGLEIRHATDVDDGTVIASLKLAAYSAPGILASDAAVPEPPRPLILRTEEPADEDPGESPVPGVVEPEPVAPALDEALPADGSAAQPEAWQPPVPEPEPAVPPPAGTSATPNESSGTSDSAAEQGLVF